MKTQSKRNSELVLDKTYYLRDQLLFAENRILFIPENKQSKLYLYNGTRTKYNRYPIMRQVRFHSAFRITKQNGISA